MPASLRLGSLHLPIGKRALSLGPVADYLSQNSPALIAEYHVRTRHMRGHAAHVLSGGPQLSQRFNLNQGAILEHPADAKIVVLRETVRRRGRGYSAIWVFHRGDLIWDFTSSSAGR
jgi:hypothetical protein